MKMKIGMMMMLMMLMMMMRTTKMVRFAHNAVKQVSFFVSRALRAQF